MKRALAQTRCECQSTLIATIAEDATVLRGVARTKTDDGVVEVSAPANVVRKYAGGGLDVGFLCPNCGRNTMRTFHLGSLVFADAS